MKIAAICAALIALAPVAAASQALPRLHITALGMHADKRVVKPGETFHVTVHVHVREKRERLDELVLPSLTNAIDLGDERRRVPAPDGTDFYETLTVEASTAGTASFSPAYIDAIDPQTNKGMRYSSAPLNVRVVSGPLLNDADPDALTALLKRAGWTLAGILAFLILAIVVVVRLARRPRKPPPPVLAPTEPLMTRPVGSAPPDPLRTALAAYRAQNDDASLDTLRNVMFARAGAGPGATFADALRALGSRDRALGRALGVAERARFGPAHERAPAGRDLVMLLDAYLGDREPVV
jgi:hypothetical protein